MTVISEETRSVYENGQGNISLSMVAPRDATLTGSFEIQFPDGMTLNEELTSLADGLSAGFSLSFTSKEHNTWLIEIQPKALRSASLRAGEAKKLLHVAYKVDEKTKRGTYDISVNSILFETKGGNYIPEPAITVSAEVNRWGVGNEVVNAPAPTVYLNAQAICIQAASAEQIAVYSVTGNKLYETTIQAGMTTINAANLPQGLLFVKGSSGWVQKVLNK
jgi:hypothetical protein